MNHILHDSDLERYLNVATEYFVYLCYSYVVAVRHLTTSSIAGIDRG